MNIAIVEDHKILAESLSSSLREQSPSAEIRVYPNGSSFLETVNGWNVDLVISDLLMPGVNSADLIKLYRQQMGEVIRIIILSSVTNKATIQQVLAGGANGYLTKEEPLEILFQAIQKVVAGESYISESIVELLKSRRENEHVNFHLSPREKDVLYLVCAGRIMKEVANELNLSVHTVQSYHNSMMRKFKVRRTSDLIVAAIRFGFYQP